MAIDSIKQRMDKAKSPEEANELLSAVTLLLPKALKDKVYQVGNTCIQ
jgi:hypothetical protein